MSGALAQLDGAIDARRPSPAKGRPERLDVGLRLQPREAAPRQTEAARFVSAAVGGLPPGDPRIWAHSMQHLVLATLRDGGCRNIADVSGQVLHEDAVVAARDRLEHIGVRPGDVVLIKAKNDVNGAAALLGAWLQGCAVCPVDPSAPASVHDLIAHHSGARAVVDSAGCVSLAEGAGASRRSRIRIGRPTGVDLGLIIFTSGSSGVPKGVMLTHGNVMSALRAISSFLEIGRDDKIFCVPPMFLDYGLYQVLFSMFTGCRLVLASGVTSPLKILALIEQAQPTILPVVPALASGLATVLNTFNQTIESLRTISNTGGHLAPATITAMSRSFPNARIFPMYGLTETKRALYLPPQLVAQKAGSVGGPMPGLDARVVVRDEAGTLAEAKAGEVGELYLRGSSVMQGYHSADSGAGARLVPGRYRDDVWLATGDLFERDEDGCLYFRGRSKSLIKQKGYCIYPRDLEAVAEGLHDVASAIVVGRDEADGDESAILFAILRGRGDEAHQDDVRARIRAKLHKSLQPKIIHFLTEWPPSPVGKIDLGALKQLARQL
ncbi:MAG: acyl--CoA ligase [Pseudonocardiales bacterium]|nr:acyl--CoA ligase [Hyphomicrobiales bacterium]MBV8825519.1 acyl--CoA ligase [Hyphomicrobiales bacterium]MBV9429445.1 acyl--CoA ligase [Bradyrhizobiaceae bacterium]MBV9728113.1 acyl--CoA ligase [Pseudonocardiales bacterium]